MRELFVVIGLQILAAVIILAEFVIPSAGILTVAAVAAFGYSLYIVWTGFSPVVAGIVGVADLLVIPVLIWFGVKVLARTPASLSDSLTRAQGAVSQDLELEKLIGAQGKAVSDLRPSGKALLNGKRFDVVTGGDYIGAESDIVVVKVDGNRIVVNAVNSLQGGV